MSVSRFGLCDRCAHQKLVQSGRGSMFSMCRLGLEDPDWPKYPRMPVERCSRFAAAGRSGTAAAQRPR
ncbi:MAG TPA: hypothetical protein VNT03_02630 [Baekduia sp.]|nr:hypothetical protein [Baekduia sp.]